MTDRLPRWVLAPASDFAHLDLGDRSPQSLRIRAEHIVVAACGDHLPDTAEVPERHRPRCFSCQRLARLMTAATPASDGDPDAPAA
jgi:hypothetical protein